MILKISLLMQIDVSQLKLQRQALLKAVEQQPDLEGIINLTDAIADEIYRQKPELEGTL